MKAEIFALIMDNINYDPSSEDTNNEFFVVGSTTNSNGLFGVSKNGRNDDRVQLIQNSTDSPTNEPLNKLEVEGVTKSNTTIEVNENREDTERVQQVENITVPAVLPQESQKLYNQTHVFEMAKKWSGVCVASLAMLLLIISWSNHSRYNREYYKRINYV